MRRQQVKTGVPEASIAGKQRRWKFDQHDLESCEIDRRNAHRCTRKD